MLLGGDELGRTQGGNNNAWCQDNEISWFDWESADGELLEFARRVIALRREHPVFRRTAFLTGKAGESGLPDVWWFRPDGRRMTQRDWTSETRTLGVFLNGREIRERTAHGEPLYRRYVPARLQRALGAGGLHAADAALRLPLAGRARDRRRAAGAARRPRSRRGAGALARPAPASLNPHRARQSFVLLTSRSVRRLHRRGSGKTPDRAGRGPPKRASREGFDAA